MIPDKILYIDFETYSTEDIRKTGVTKYVNCKEFKILLLAYATGDAKVVVEDRINKKVSDCLNDPEFFIVAHNARFEALCLRRVGFNIPMKRFIDTAMIARSMCLPPDLKGLSAYMGGTRKLETGTALINLFCKPDKKGNRVLPSRDQATQQKWEQFAEYCRVDVEAMRDIYRKIHSHPIPEWEEKLWHLDSKINDRGIPLDIPTVKKARRIAENYKEEKTKQFRGITGVNPTQRDKILKWCEERGVKLPGLTAGNVQTALDGELPDKVRSALKIRQKVSKTSLKKMETMINASNDDGRVMDTLQFHAATTGRWGGRLIQIQNFPRPTIKNVDEAIKAINNDTFDSVNFNCPRMEALSSTLRGMIKAQKRHRFIVSDFSSIEARVLTWMVGQENKLELYRKGEDLYIDMAAGVFNKPKSKILKGSAERQLGKTLVLGAGYGVGSKKFVDVCNAMRLKISTEMAVKAIESFRSAYNKVVGFWYKVGDICIHVVKTRATHVLNTKYCKFRFSMVGGNLLITLPSGRNLTYPLPCLRDRATPWGDVRQALHFYGKESGRVNWCLQSTYGGKLTENITQAIARDLLAFAMMRVEKNGYKIIGSVHDEIICEMPNKKGSIEHLNELMEINPEWAKGLPIGAEGYESKRYKK